MMNPYKILGVEPTDTLDEIKAKYKKLAKIHHPDKGGDPDTMSELTVAFSILSDPDKRKRFDETGMVDPKLSEEAEISSYLNSIFAKVISDESVSVSNIIAKCERVFSDEMHGMEEHIRKFRRRIKNLEEIQKKKGSVNKKTSKSEKSRKEQFSYILNDTIMHCKKECDKIDHLIEINKKAREQLKSFMDSGDEKSYSMGFAFIPTASSSTTW